MKTHSQDRVRALSASLLLLAGCAALPSPAAPPPMAVPGTSVIPGGPHGASRAITLAEMNSGRCGFGTTHGVESAPRRRRQRKRAVIQASTPAPHDGLTIA